MRHLHSLLLAMLQGIVIERVDVDWGRPVGMMNGAAIVSFNLGLSGQDGRAEFIGRISSKGRGLRKSRL